MTASLSVFGLGYVGCVSAACFAKQGFQVTGVDVNKDKVRLISNGRSTIHERGIGDLVRETVAAGRLKATTDVVEAIRTSTISLICVGTPSKPNGDIDLTYIERVSRDIGTALRGKREFHTVIIRSTVLPGTIHGRVIPTLEQASAKTVGAQIAVCSNPEFLREGSSIDDFYDPPFTLIGADDTETTKRVASLYASLEAPLYTTSIPIAEVVKYACNCFHGLKVGFANEVGTLCKHLGIDSHEVMRLFCEDRKLNISPAYLKPGFAFGGSCLPKDIRAVLYRGKALDLDLPILQATLESNRKQIDRAFDLIVSTGHRRIGIVGMSFKEGTDDLRESPMVSLIERLIGRGMELAIYDRQVSQSQLVGANREYIEREIPHIWTLVKPDLASVLEGADTIVVGSKAVDSDLLHRCLDAGAVVVDLVRAIDGQTSSDNYHGMAW